MKHSFILFDENFNFLLKDELKLKYPKSDAGRLLIYRLSNLSTEANLEII